MSIRRTIVMKSPLGEGFRISAIVLNDETTLLSFHSLVVYIFHQFYQPSL